MKIFKIVKDNKKSLREKSVEVTLPLSKEDKETLFEMLEYLKVSQDDELANKYGIRSGVGLAAPQIGLNKCMLAIYIPTEKEIYQYLLVNPVIVSESAKLAYLEQGEGCLSVDKDHKGYVYRHYKVRVKAFDALVNKDVELVFTGYLAIVVQHEIDHLKGILYYDHINKLEPFKKLPNSVSIG